MIYSSIKTISFLFASLFIAAIAMVGCSASSADSVELSISIDPAEAGTVIPETGTYQKGERIALTAEPAEGYQFVRWEGQISGEENPITILMNGNRRVTAVFRENPFQAGDGSAENPYTVSGFDGLMEMRKNENLDKHYIQIGDIDGAAHPGKNDRTVLNPIGSREAPFTGSYNGNGHIITGISELYSDRTDPHVGLFGYVRDGVIENVHITNASPGKIKTIYHGNYLAKSGVMGNSEIPDFDVDELQFMGSIVGFNDGGIIRNSHSDIALGSRRHFIGGLVGYSSGEIISSTVNANITASGFAGGLVAFNEGLVEDSFASGKISGTGAAGGLAGMNDGGLIIRSYSDGEVDSDFRTAGLAGVNSGRIENSFAMGTVTSGRGPAGGFAGINGGNISNSYSTVSVSAFESGESTGGFVGLNTQSASVDVSYATGLITIAEGLVVGGFAGNNKGQVSATYWDTNTTGQNDGVGEGNSAGATGLTTNEMSGPAAEQNMPEFDWVNIWRTTEDGYPVLRREEL